jgi:hypothetical protein
MADRASRTLLPRPCRVRPMTGEDEALEARNGLAKSAVTYARREGSGNHESDRRRTLARSEQGRRGA